MSKNKKVFQRREKKYLLSFTQYEKLRKALMGQMEADRYGLHTISSLYYDTKNYDLIQASIEKPVYKEKFRLRSYGIVKKEEKVFMEIKKKYKGIVGKRRVFLPLEEITSYIQTGELTSVIENDCQQIMAEISYFIKKYEIEPKVMIIYDRIALFSQQDHDFRITFDFNIRWRSDDLDLTHGDYGRILAPNLDCLMEVKALGAFPLWFSKILSKLEIYPGSFSKFARCYTNCLLPCKTAERLEYTRHENQQQYPKNEELLLRL